MIDQILQGLCDLFELTFPGRIRSIYLIGSQAGGPGNTHPHSDIDLRVIFRNDFLPGELERFYKVRQVARQLCSLRFDCPPLSEARLQTEKWLHEVVSMKTESTHLRGEDLKDILPSPSLEAFTRNVTAAPMRFVRELHNLEATQPVPYPLDYPDPKGEFLGYERSGGTASPPAGELKLLVHVIGFMATCRLAFEAGQIVGRKEDWLPTYKQFIHDGWGIYLDELYTDCREIWQYSIPEGAKERIQLRQLCRQALAFENDYLERYRNYLNGEIESGNSARQAFARERLGELVW